MELTAAPQYLVIATSGRTLARSAYRGGSSVCVLDLFADADTQQYASICKRLVSSNWELDSQNVLAVANAYCPPPTPLVPGSGFENRTDLLGTLGFGRTLLGNQPDTVALTKNPAYFFSLLDELDIPHPLTVLTTPANYDEGWLVKTIGASGGAHVDFCNDGNVLGNGKYFQKYVVGKPASVLFLADGNRSRIIGFNEVWCKGGNENRFTYGGAINRIKLSRRLQSRIVADVEALVRAIGLVGVNGMDFIACGDEYYVLEINPRPTATLDLHDEHACGSLFDLHVAACAGQLPLELPRSSQLVRSHHVVYAPHPINVPKEFAFPNWCSDLPSTDTTFHENEPICMVHAEGTRVDRVKRLIQQRGREIINLLVERVI